MKMKMIFASLLLITPWAMHSMAPQEPAVRIMNPAKDEFLGGYADGSVKIFDQTTKELLHDLKGPTPNQPIQSGAFDETGKRVAAGSRGTVEIWDVMTGNLIRTISVEVPEDPTLISRVPEVPADFIGTVTFEGNNIRITPQGHSIQIWDITTGNRIE